MANKPTKKKEKYSQKKINTFGTEKECIQNINYSYVQQTMQSKRGERGERGDKKTRRKSF